jgi:hypothetical protein
MSGYVLTPPIYEFSLPVHLHIRRFILKGLASSTGGLVRGYSAVCRREMSFYL